MTTLLAVVFMAFGLIQGEAGEKWEDVAIAGVLSMNRGEGEKFVKIAHTEHKEQMRFFMIRMLESSRENQLPERLKPFGVKSLEDFKKLDLDAVVSTFVAEMHKNTREPMKSLMKTMRCVCKSSKLDNDLGVVKAEGTISDGKKTKTFPMTLLVKKEKGVWKYCGEKKIED